MARPKKPQPKKKGRVVKFVVIGVAACVGLTWWIWENLDMSVTRPVTVEVTAHEWKRTIQVQQYGTYHEEEWCSRMPDAAVDVTRTKRKWGTKDVYKGEDCSWRNGERDCESVYEEADVFEFWCEYTYTGWKTVRTEEATGDGVGDDLYWPPLDLPGEDEAEAVDGALRQGRRQESLYVTLQTAGGETRACSVDEARFRSMEPGSRWRAGKSIRYGTILCDDLQSRD